MHAVVLCKVALKIKQLISYWLQTEYDLIHYNHMLPHIYFLHVIREYLHIPPKEEIRTTLIPTVVEMCKIIC